MKAVTKQGRRFAIPVNSIHQVDKEHDEKWKKEGTKIRPIFFKVFFNVIHISYIERGRNVVSCLCKAL